MVAHLTSPYSGRFPGCAPDALIHALPGSSCPDHAGRRSRPGPWSAPRGLKSSAPGPYPCAMQKLAPQGVLFFAPSATYGVRPSASQQTKQEGPLHTPCAEGTGGRATPPGATIDALRMAAYALQTRHDYPYNPATLLIALKRGFCLYLGHSHKSSPVGHTKMTLRERRRCWCVAVAVVAHGGRAWKGMGLDRGLPLCTAHCLNLVQPYG